MVYRSSIKSVTKNSSPAFVVRGFPLLLPLDFIYSTPQIAVYSTQSDYVSTRKQNVQGTHQLMQEFMNVEQKSQKTYYDRSRYGRSFKVGEELLVFNPTVKKVKLEK